MSELFQQIVNSLAALPPSLVYAIIGLLGAVENIFPPIPADTAIAFGAFLSQSNELSALTIFLVTWSANVAGASAVYTVARYYGRPFFSGHLGERLLKPRHFARLEQLYHDHGTWGIFLSRFIPGVRAVVSPFSGIAGLSAFRALTPVFIASAIWYGALTFVAARVARELDTVLLFVSRFNTTALILLVVAVIVVLVALRSRKGPRRGR